MENVAYGRFTDDSHLLLIATMVVIINVGLDFLNKKELVMIISIVGTILLIAAVVVPGTLLMSTIMNVLAPRVGIPASGVIASVIGAASQLGLGLVVLHLVAAILVIL